MLIISLYIILIIFYVFYTNFYIEDKDYNFDYLNYYYLDFENLNLNNNNIYNQYFLFFNLFFFKKNKLKKNITLILFFKCLFLRIKGFFRLFFLFCYMLENKKSDPQIDILIIN